MPDAKESLEQAVLVKMSSMYCSYHPSNAARVGCANCRRPLCSYCDHRIKGYPYCQDCIVMGIDALGRSKQSQRKVKRNARFAALLALVPGLGAAFNHQNVKAIFHFVGVMLLFQLTEIRALDVFFALGGTAFYFYTIVDAYRTADRIARGEDPRVDEARFKKSLLARARGLGVLLLATGALLLIQLLHPFGIEVSLVRLLPVILILLGGYLLVSRVKQSREEDMPAVYTPHQPYPLLPVETQATRVRQYAASGRGDDLT